MKNFRQIILLVVITNAILSSKAQMEKFTIHGKTLWNVDSVSLISLDSNENYSVIKTVKVNSEGEYFFDGTLSEPTELILKIKEVEKRLFIEGGDIYIKDSATQSTFVVKGSVLTDQMDNYYKNIYNDKFAFVQASNFLETINQASNKAEYDSVKYSGEVFLSNIYYKTMEFIKNHNQSYFSLYLLNYYSKSYALRDVKFLFESLDNKLKNYTLYIKLNGKIRLYETLEPGMHAPPFKLIDQNGNEINLEKLLGKYVLLDFWASWCGPCLQNMPNLKSLRSKIDRNDLEVLFISFDLHKENWEAALKKIGLKNVINIRLNDGFRNDLSFSYDIRFIPFSVLIDPFGNLTGMNLTNDEIVRKIKPNNLSHN